MSEAFILRSQQAAWYLRSPLIEAEPGAGNDNTLVLNNSSGSPVSLTGLDAIGMYGGRTHDVLNRGADPIELLPNNNESQAAFQFADAAVIAGNASLRLYYNGLRWEVLSSSYMTADDPLISIAGLNLLGYVAFDTKGVETVPIRVLAAASGNVDIYTVPPGKKAILRDINVTNPTGGAIAATPQIKTVGGAYYRHETTRAIAANNFSRFATSFIANAGEKFAFNFAASGLNCYGEVLLFPDTVPVKTERLTDVPLVPTTLYAVPAGKKASPCSVTQFNTPLGQIQSGSNLQFTNSTAAPITLTIYVVPSGEAAGLPNQVLVASLAAASQVAHNIAVFLKAGDAVAVKASAAGLVAWVTVFETDAPEVPTVLQASVPREKRRRWRRESNGN